MLDPVQIDALFQSATRLTARAEALTDPRRPYLLRLLCAAHAERLLERAQDQLDQISVLVGRPAVRAPGTRLGMRRPAWLVLQWSIGILNASTALQAFSERHWVVGTISTVCMLVTTQWRLPRKPFNYKPRK